MYEPDPPSAPRRHATVPYGTLLGRALKLKCPRCGQGQMFDGFFSTLERCPHCQLKYERAPGYFLGSIYVNYGLTALAITILYSVLHIGFRWTNTQLAFPLAGFCCLFPALAFRHTRAIWLAMDCHWDESLMEVDDEQQSD